MSQYNKPAAERHGIKNLFQFISKGLMMEGFQVGQLMPKWSESHREDVQKWLEDGSVHAKIDETVGIAKAAEGFIAMLEGGNMGKAVVRIHEQM